MSLGSGVGLGQVGCKDRFKLIKLGLICLLRDLDNLISESDGDLFQ